MQDLALIFASLVMHTRQPGTLDVDPNQACLHAAHSLDWAPVSGVSKILPMTCLLSKALNASGACSNGNLHHIHCNLKPTYRAPSRM